MNSMLEELSEIFQDIESIVGKDYQYNVLLVYKYGDGLNIDYSRVLFSITTEDIAVEVLPEKYGQEVAKHPRFNERVIYSCNGTWSEIVDELAELGYVCLYNPSDTISPPKGEHLRNQVISCVM